MNADRELPVVVSSIEGAHLAQSIKIGAHELRADEPAVLGGADSGPGPHDLLLAALGACTSMTLRLYAERKGWDLGQVTVRLGIRWEKVEGRSDKRVVIERIVESDRVLSPAQQARLIEIADKCPVHKTLMGDKTVTTRLLAALPEA